MLSISPRSTTSETRKGKGMLLIILLLILIIPIQLYAQENNEINIEKPQANIFKPSVYIGTGLGTNLGGAIGIGCELQVKNMVSVSAAVGSIHTVLEQESEFSKFDFDVGGKLYLMKYVYCGVNYGMIDYYILHIHGRDPITGEYLSVDEQRKIRGISFTIGVRTPEYKKFYLSGYFGTTNKKEANCSDANGLIGEICIPRIGLMLGYNLSHLLYKK